MAFEITVRGGTVMDGTGAPGRRADVAIDHGRVVEIGPGLRGQVEVDASGMVVAPGFIDIHTHYDAQVFWDPGLTPSSWHGVTSVVAGNCGFSLAPCRPEHRGRIFRTLQHVEDMNVPTLEQGVRWEFETFPQYLEAISAQGTTLNFAAYLGHTALRLFVMGDEADLRSEATEVELRRMAELVEEALVAGAVGLATSASRSHIGDGGRPVPSCLADRTEIERLLEPLRRLDRGVVAFSPGVGLTHGDIYELQRLIRRPFTWSPLLAVRNATVTQEMRTLHAQGRDAGADVWPQVTCRPLTLQMTLEDPFSFNMTAAFRNLMSGTHADRIAAYKDESWRATARADVAATTVMQQSWNTITVGESRNHSALEGRTIASLAAAQGKEPLDVMLDIALDEDLTTWFKTVIANDDSAMVAELLSEQQVLLGLSDAGAHVGQLCDACLPTDLLGNWVRERQVLSLETAVHKLTGEPAGVFGFADRGLLQPGMAADITVFDPSTVAPGPLRRIVDFPADGERLVADAPTGITHVLVNGTPIRMNGSTQPIDPDARPGRVLRPGS